MSYRELTMIDVKEVLRRWQAGQSARQIAREGVAGRATAGRYIDAAQQLGPRARHTAAGRGAAPVVGKWRPATAPFA
jgi:hypothetical protein